MASASSFIQFDRQLRQKPARFIRSMFWTSVRERRCPTRRRKAAASSSVLVLSSIVMALGPALVGTIRKNRTLFSLKIMPQLRTQHIDIRWELSQILPYRRAKQGPSGGNFDLSASSRYTGGPRQIVNHLI